MPTIQINNENLFFDNVYYVHGTNGNDTTGTGSVITPFKTFTRAYNSCNLYNDAIYLMGDDNSNYLDYTASINKNISIIGDGLTSKLHGSITYTNYIWTSSTGNVKLYRLWLQAGQFFRSSPNIKNEWYNCVITVGIGLASDTQTPISNRPLFQNCILDNRGTSYGYYRANCYIENSIIIGKSDGWVDYGNNNGKTLKTTLNNNNFIEYTDEGKALPSSTTFSYTVNSDFTLSGVTWQNLGTGLNPDGSIAHIGIYGGIYAFGDWSISSY